MNGCHVENLSWFFSERPEIWWIAAPLSSSKASRLEITGFHSVKVVCESGNLSSDILFSVVLHESFLLSKFSQVSSSSSSEK